MSVLAIRIKIYLNERIYLFLILLYYINNSLPDTCTGCFGLKMQVGDSIFKNLVSQHIVVDQSNTLPEILHMVKMQYYFFCIKILKKFNLCDFV